MFQRGKTEKSKVLIGRGPTTRSRANTVISQKQGTEDATEKENQSLSHMEPAEPLIQLPSIEANGSMEAFWAMRKRQKEAAAATSKISPSTTATTKTATENVVEENVFPDIEEEEEAGIFFPLFMIT